MVPDNALPVLPEAGALVGGRYKLLSKISEGGGGVVWEAENPFGNPVAFKFLKWSPLKTKNTIAERFKNEFAILKSLSHPNISEIYDFGFDMPTGLYFFTSELLRAGDLRTIIGKPIPVIEELFLQALRALEYLRGNKLFHFDIKPQNLLLRRLGDEPELAVIDFGLATLRPPDKPGGTASYMPPEMVVRRLELFDEINKYPQPDHRSDLYSLGVTFYYCLTGVQPFFTATENGGREVDSQATMQKHLSYVPPPPSHYNPDVPSYLDRIIMKLMAIHPDDRYPSAIVAAQGLQYSSPINHAPESTQTLLAYLPKEGHMVGRKKESATIEEAIRDIKLDKSKTIPIICISGGRGVGRTRLIKSVKPFAQQEEIEVVEMGLAELEDVGIMERLPYNPRASVSGTYLLLIDDIEQYITGKVGEAGFSGLSTIIRRLKLQHRLQNAPRPRYLLIFTLSTDKCDLKEVLTTLNLNDDFQKTVFINNFTRDEISEYLETVLGEVPDDSVVTQLASCTDGNPLFLTEHLEGMIAKGQLFSLAGRPDVKTLSSIGIDFAMTPPSKSLSDTIAEKLSLITSGARRLALLLACWQRPASADELEATCAKGDVSRELLLLMSAGFIRRDEKNGRFYFVNAMAARIIRERSTVKECEHVHDLIAKYLKTKRRVKQEELDLHLAYGSNENDRMGALERLIKSETEANNPQLVISHMERLLKFITSDDTKKRAAILVALGMACERARRIDDAKAAYQKLKVIKAPADLQKQFRVQASLQIGLLCMRRRQLTHARKYFNEALSLLNNTPSLLVWKIRIENYIAGVDLRDGRIEEAVMRFEKTKALAEKSIKKSERDKINNNELGEALLRLGRVKDALVILKSELNTAIEMKDETRAANRYYLIGDALRHDDVRDYNEALASYQMALKMARARHLAELEVRIHNGLGNLCLKMGTPQKALTHYEEGLKIAQQIEGDTTSVELMIGMGLASLQMSSADNVIEYFEAALDFSKGPKGGFAGLIRRYSPTIYVSLADAYCKKRDFEKAEKYLKAAMMLDNKKHLSPDIRYSLYGTYIELYLERGNVHEAEKLMPTLRSVAKAFPQAADHMKTIEHSVGSKSLQQG